MPAGRTAILHTVPFYEGSHMLSAVCQFSCIERERKSFGDDGTFNQYNRSHFKLLNQFLGYVQAYLTRWYLMKERVRQASHWDFAAKKMRTAGKLIKMARNSNVNIGMEEALKVRK